ncbi:MAG: hypothetical protein HC846_09365 [Blastocatellia bacterium]|nr:hypothetical protein [Blastocatellia bacterium]
MKCNLGKRQIIFQLLFFSFLFSGIALAQLESKPTPRSEVATPSKFEFLTVNGQAVANAIEPCERSLAECGDERIGLFGYEGLGGPDSDNPKTETFIFRSGKKTIGIFLLTVMNNEDDSVGGERIRIVFEKKATGGITSKRDDSLNVCGEQTQKLGRRISVRRIVIFL